MRFRVHNVRAEDVDAALVVRILQQVEVLERLGEKEGLHAVLEGVGSDVVDVGERGVARRSATPSLKALEDGPSPLPVELVVGDLVQSVRRDSRPFRGATGCGRRRARRTCRCSPSRRRARETRRPRAPDRFW